MILRYEDLSFHRGCSIKYVYSTKPRQREKFAFILKSRPLSADTEYVSALLAAAVRASTKETFMAGLKYQLLKLISHPVSAFFFFGSVVFSAALFVIYS
ncbi:hypothetical protein [Symbiopectobacterium sp. RP]|uniref:hypothetical protein n=1 Tax=Symbiopectobacterium sp. RP TaxID=3248553 RepID=UPI003D2CE5E1